MNQLVTTAPRGLALPTDSHAAMMLARDLSTARTIPSTFQKSPADCYNVLSICARFGFDFYSTIWECSIIKNRLFLSGKMTHAMLNASGYLAERLDFEYTAGPKDKDGKEDLDGRKVTVRGRIQGETQQRIVEVFVGEVKTGNEHWTKSPDQMLSYAGARIWGRRHLPEVMLGLMFTEEAELIDVTPDVPTITPELKPAASPSTPYGEQLAQPEPPTPADPYSMEPPAQLDDHDQWRAWAMEYVANVRAGTVAEDRA